MEIGFYWIKTPDGDSVAEFDGKYWWYVGTEFTSSELFINCEIICKIAKPD